MGSTSKRYPVDEVIIRHQAKKTSGGSGGAKKEDFNPNSCPITVKIRIPNDGGLRIGDKLIMEIKGDSIVIIRNNEIVVTVKGERLVKKLMPCLRYGFRYPGKAVKSGQDWYGEFIRTIK